MKQRSVFVGLAILAIGILAVGAALANPSRQGPDGQNAPTLRNQRTGPVQASWSSSSGTGRHNLVGGDEPAGAGINASPVGLFNYQGQLLQDGSPFDGTIVITFSLYFTDTGDIAWWQEMQTVQVDNGLFNVMLGVVDPLDDEAVWFSNQVYLGIQPEGAAELTPRQPLATVGYAMNLMPGATMVDTNNGTPYWTSFYVYSENHPAIYGASGDDVGVRGETYYTETAGVEGNAMGNDGYGVAGRNYGSSTSCSIGDTACAAGLYGTALGDSYASFFYGVNRSGIIDIQGDNTFYGLWVYSLIEPDGSGIWTNGESYFNDYVTFGGGKSGYVVDIALNDGDEPLEKGDVVVISGYDVPVVGNVPVIRVAKANGANASGVIGVVDVLYVPCVEESLEAGQACGGFETSVTTIQPGEYLSVVTLGAYEMIKVDASGGPVRPGDLLVASASTGYAMKATPLTVEGVSFYAPGTIIGKALGALDEGIGFIPVFVSAR